MRFGLLFLLALGACGSTQCCADTPAPTTGNGERGNCRPEPPILLTFDDNWAGEEMLEIVDASLEWRRLCFDVRPSVSTLHAPPNACVIRIVRTAELRGTPYLGWAEFKRGEVYIIDNIDPSKLRAVAAHEVGHMLIGGYHLTSESYGVMHRVANVRYLTEADRQLACEHTGRCTWCDATLDDPIY